MRIEEINEEMELNLPESDDYETIAGFILNLLGHIPRQGEQMKYNNLKLVITKMRGNKIEEIVLNKQRTRKRKQATTTKKSDEGLTPAETDTTDNDQKKDQ
jgi:CBS domain containing-hemolysin-like protein